MRRNAWNRERGVIIDTDWIKRVRKTWKTWLKRADTRVSDFQSAWKHFIEARQWFEALAYDIAYAKGFFTIKPDKKEQVTETTKNKRKVLKALNETLHYLKTGEEHIIFWKDTFTPGTVDWKLGLSHRISVGEAIVRDNGLHLRTPEEIEEYLNSHPEELEEWVDRSSARRFKIGMETVDRIFNRKFLGYLTRIGPIHRDLHFQPLLREFSIGNAKVIMQDVQDPLTESVGYPPEQKIKDYIFLLQKAENLLKMKGLGFLWYGNFFIRAPGKGGPNPLGDKWKIGATYNLRRDAIVIYEKPYQGLAKLVAHELGHRYWYKFMTSTQRARFFAEFVAEDPWLSKIPAVSEYGNVNAEEDFAEVFAWYVDNRNLTRPQLERLKQYFTSRGKRASQYAFRTSRSHSLASWK